MKTLVEKEIGGDGAKAGLYVEKNSLNLSIKYPIEKIIEPVAKVADKAIDQLDKWIPGDQKEIGDKLKKEIREELAELLAEQMA